MSKKQEELDALQHMEGNNQENQEQSQVASAPAEAPVNEQKQANLLDGYRRIDKMMPQQGALYPDSWEFAYRCPTAKEVANFSTINENDQAAIIVAVEDLIRKCVIIYDTEQKKRINTGEICDAHRTFFLLNLRDFYLPGNPIKYKNTCQTCHDTFEVNLTADKLIYNELTEKLLNAYDGRVFTFDMGLEEPVIIRIPTLETSGRIFKYIVKIYRGNQMNQEERKSDNIIYDKQFLLFAPFLYKTGNETIRELGFKFKAIQKNEKLFKAYLTIINNIKLENEEYFDEICPSCGSEEEAQIKFPGGWKKLFVTSGDTTGYFG